MRDLLRAGSSAAVLLTMVVVGSVVLWVGVPVLWLWLASQLVYLSGSVAAGLSISFLGMVLTIVGLVQVLAWLNLAHLHLREARGLPGYGTVTLEGILVVSAGLATAAFAVWFLFWGGPRSFGGGG